MESEREIRKIKYGEMLEQGKHYQGSTPHIYMVLDVGGNGMHLSPAIELSKKVKNMASDLEVAIYKNEDLDPIKNPLDDPSEHEFSKIGPYSLLGLGATKGSQIIVRACGDNVREELGKIRDYFNEELFKSH